MMPEQPEPTVPKHTTKWPKGRSGNPGGRPAGSRNKVLVALDKIGEEAAGDVLQAVVSAARGGDLGAAGILLSRVWPARKGRPVTFGIPRLETAGDVVGALTAVVQAVANGILTPDEGQAVATMLEMHRKAIDTTEIEARLAALEARKP